MSKGQLSIILKPMMLIILVIVFGLFVIRTVKFNAQTQQDVNEYEYRLKVNSIFDKITECVSTETRDYKYNLNATLLNQFTKAYDDQEPECAEDYEYGWNVSIVASCLTDYVYVRSNEEIDIVFIVDTSSSMDNERVSICKTIIPDTLNVLKSKGYNVKEFVYGLETTGNCGDAALQGLGDEAWARGAKWVSENHPWRGGSRIIFTLSDSAPLGHAIGDKWGSCWPSPVGYCYPKAEVHVQAVQDAIQAAVANGVQVYSVYGDCPLECPCGQGADIGCPDKTCGDCDGNDKYAGNGRNDIIDAMEELSLGTGGESIGYRDTPQLAEFTIDVIERQPQNETLLELCTSEFIKPNWSFGSKEGSFDNALDNKIIFLRPVTVTWDLFTSYPAVMKLEVREGDLEAVVGAIDNIYKSGKEIQKDFKGNLLITLNYAIKTEQRGPYKYLCMETQNKKSCERLKAANIQFPRDLKPGKYIFNIIYTAAGDKITVNV